MDTDTATNFRALLQAAKLSQLGAAKAMGIDPRTIRRYCLGESRVPRVVMLAAERLRDLRTIAELD